MSPVAPQRKSPNVDYVGDMQKLSEYWVARITQVYPTVVWDYFKLTPF